MSDHHEEMESHYASMQERDALPAAEERIAQLEFALTEAAERMDRATVFVTSRERIKHPEGTDLWRDYIAEARAVAERRAFIGSAPVEPLHLVTQEGQPYGSIRRCCERCGRMCWPGLKGSAKRWTNSPDSFDTAPDRCDRVNAPSVSSASS